MLKIKVNRKLLSDWLFGIFVVSLYILIVWMILDQLSQ
jgi:phage-related holin